MSINEEPAACTIQELPDKELMLKMYRNMNLGRRFEEHVQWLFSKGLVHGTTHLGIGEEATAAGSIAALKPRDYVFGTHRGHSQAIAKGIEVRLMMAEILARETGVCKGKGGSMQIADPDIFYFGADGILGASAVMCNGTALAIKKRGEKDRISTVFFGDGTSNEGATWEAMNLAAVWNLPTLFICVNNTYGMSTPIADALRRWSDISALKARRASGGASMPVLAFSVVSSASISESCSMSDARRVDRDSRQFSRSWLRYWVYSSMRISA